MTSSVSGLGSGLDINSLIQELMSAERGPQNLLVSQKTEVTAQQNAWSDLLTKMTALQTAATGIGDTTQAALAAATSSDTTLLTATASPGAQLGSTTLRVDSLAAADQIASAGFATTSDLVGAGTFSTGTGFTAMGLAGASADGTVTTGTHTVTVTQASAGAALIGTDLSSLPTITSLNDTLTVTLPSGTLSASLNPSKTYTSLADMATDLQAGFGSAVKVSVSGQHLVLTSAAEGSDVSMSVSGNAAATLGFTSGASATGVDATASVDGGTAQTFSMSSGSATIGGITLTGSHLGTGTASLTVVQTSASTTVSDLVTAINAAGGTVSASAIDVGSGSTPVQLVLTSKNTGTANALTVSSSGSTVLGQPFDELRAASDAVLSMGSMTITRSTNTISDVISGVTLNLAKADPNTDVTINVSRDTAGMATKVQALIDAMNSIVDTVNTDTKYDVANHSGGPLVGDSTARGIRDGLWSVESGVSSLSKFGISIDRDGHYTFDSAAFTKAASSDPDGAVTSISTLATGVSTWTKPQTMFGGLLANERDSAANQIKTLSDQISDWDTRLQTIQDRYTQEFSAMDAAVGQMKALESQLSAGLSSLGH